MACCSAGDHILNGSTTVIDPPDGNMADYLDSPGTGSMPCAPNTTWSSSCPRTAMCWTMRGRHRPAQGPPPGARGESAGRHAGAARRQPEDWVRHAYSDVPPRMWPVAQRSLLAHVERIRTCHRATIELPLHKNNNEPRLHDNDRTPDPLPIRLAKRVARAVELPRSTAEQFIEGGL